MNKAFIIHYVEDNRSLIMASEDISTLVEQIAELHENDLVTDIKYIETIFYIYPEGLFEYINKTLPKLPVRRKD